MPLGLGGPVFGDAQNPRNAFPEFGFADGLDQEIQCAVPEGPDGQLLGMLQRGEDGRNRSITLLELFKQ